MDYKKIYEEIKTFLSAEEVDKEVQSVELAEEVKSEENVEVKEQEAPAPSYVSREEMLSAMKEMEDKYNAMFEKILELARPQEKQDVPAELSKEKVEEVEVELAEEIVHSPEQDVEEVKMHRIAPNRAMSSTDRVFNQLFG